MKRFSIGASIGDGFGLIRRRPLSVLVWGLLLVAPGLGSVGLAFPALVEIFANLPAPDAGTPADEAVTDQMFAAMVQLQLASMLINIGQLVIMAIVYTAIFRAVLRPAERGFFSLRLGMDELRVAVVGLAIGVGLYLAMIVLVLVGAALIVALWSVDATLGAAGLAIYVLLTLVAVCWAMARVSLMAPASVLHRDFAFVEGWRLASGKTWPLLGMTILILLVILALEIVAFLLGLLVFAGVWASVAPAWVADAALVPELGGWLAANWYWVAIAAVPASFVYGAVLVLATAPFASACRQLADGDDPATGRIDAGSPVPA